MNSATYVAKNLRMAYARALVEHFTESNVLCREYIARAQQISMLLVKRMPSSEVRRILNLTIKGREFLAEQESVIAQAQRISTVLRTLDGGPELKALLDEIQKPQEPTV